MIGKVACGASLRQAFRYATRKPGATIIGGNVAPLIRSGEQAEQEQNELIENALNRLEFASGLNPNVQRHCYHLKVSLSLYDRELSDEEFSRLGDEFLAGLILSSENPGLFDRDESEMNQEINQFIAEELDKYQYAIVRHHDTEHQHIHVVLNRVNLETAKPIQRDWDVYRCQSVLRHLEKRFDLEKNRNSWEIPIEEKRRETQGEKEITQVYSPLLKAEINEIWNCLPNLDIHGERYRLRTGRQSINLYRKGTGRAIARLKRDGTMTASSLKQEDFETVQQLRKAQQEAIFRKAQQEIIDLQLRQRQQQNRKKNRSKGLDR